MISLTTLKAVIEYLYVLDAKARKIVCYCPLVHEENVITKKKLSVEFRQICFSIGKEQKKISSQITPSCSSPLHSIFIKHVWSLSYSIRALLSTINCDSELIG